MEVTCICSNTPQHNSLNKFLIKGKNVISQIYLWTIFRNKIQITQKQLISISPQHSTKYYMPKLSKKARNWKWNEEENERQWDNTNIYMENLQGDKKPWFQTNKKFYYEKQSRCTRIYLVQDLQSLMDYLISTFTPHQHSFIFKNMLGVLPKLDLILLLETPSRRK